jgi:hypothetical protein
LPKNAPRSRPACEDLRDTTDEEAPVKLRRTVLATAAAGLLFSLATPTAATAASGACDPGWTELQGIRAYQTTDEPIPPGNIGSVCRGPGAGVPIKVNLNLANLPSTGTYRLDYSENTFGGPNTQGQQLNQGATGSYTPANTQVSSETLTQKLPGSTVFVTITVTGTFETFTSVLEATPVSVLIPKTGAQVSAAKKVRDKSVAKAKKTYKAVIKKQKSSKTSRSKKAKKAYKKSVTKAQTTFKKATAPTPGVINSVTVRKVPKAPGGYDADMGVGTYTDN